MDVPRSPEILKKKKQKRVVYAIAGGAAILLVTLGLARLKPAARSVERSSVWIDGVKRGPMLRQVRGLGTLVPEEIRWIPAQTQGRVERLVTLPGTDVKADTVVLELSNPEVELLALDAESKLRAAIASYTELKVRLNSTRLDQEAAAAKVQSDYAQAKMRADTDSELAKEGLVPDLTRKMSEVTAAELANRDRIEKERLAGAGESVVAQLAVQAAAVEQARAQARVRREQVNALKVRAGIDGVLQQIPVEVGQQVGPGTNLARVAQPWKLKAVVRVPETQAKDVLIGQVAEVDTRNGIVQGKVARVDPAVQNGTVTVDIALTGELPKGARPDLTVDGTIELERLTDVVFVGRPAQGQPESQISLFRLEADGVHASRVKVTLGRASVSTVEVRDGLQPGEQVILSDTSAWDASDRVRLN
ncbi:MAG: efflux RND transporter periplasmic adaptor subunit [Vicinamibacteria bacterium]